MARTWISTLAFVLVSCFIVPTAGCGSSPESSEDDPLAAYFAAVKQVGEEAASQFASVSGDSDPNAPWRERRLVLQAIAPIANEWVDALARITPPPPIAPQHREFVATIRSLMDILVAGADFPSPEEAASFYDTAGFRNETLRLLEICRDLQGFADANNVEADVGCEGLFQRLQ